MPTFPPTTTAAGNTGGIEPVQLGALAKGITVAELDLHLKIAGAQIIIEHLEQECARLVKEIQLESEGATGAQLPGPRAPAPARLPEPARSAAPRRHPGAASDLTGTRPLAPAPEQLPGPRRSWTAAREARDTPRAAAASGGRPPARRETEFVTTEYVTDGPFPAVVLVISRQPQIPPETEEVAEEPPAPDGQIMVYDTGPAERNVLGWKQGAARALRPLKRGTTTLSVRNLPARFLQEDLVEEWLPEGSIDFLYRPYASNEEKVLGHAFVNFTSGAAAAAFQAKWHGKFFRRHGKGRALDIVGATTQGYKHNLQATLRRLGALQGDYHYHVLPAVFRGTARLDALEEAARLNIQVPGQEKLLSLRRNEFAREAAPLLRWQ